LIGSNIDSISKYCTILIGDKINTGKGTSNIILSTGGPNANFNENNTIILNTGSLSPPFKTKAFYVNPIRAQRVRPNMAYDPSSKEVTYVNRNLSLKFDENNKFTTIPSSLSNTDLTYDYIDFSGPVSKDIGNQTVVGFDGSGHMLQITKDSHNDLLPVGIVQDYSEKEGTGKIAISGICEYNSRLLLLNIQVLQKDHAPLNTAIIPGCYILGSYIS